MRPFFIGSCLFLLLTAFSTTLHAQQDSTQVEEDFSLYADAELADGAKRFCTSKVFDQSPNKLISIGYDFQGPHRLNAGGFNQYPQESAELARVSGLRISSSFPLISKTNILIGLGLNYWETRYAFNEPVQHPLSQTLANRGLRTAGVSTTIFKPLNEKNFLLVQASADLSGDYVLPSLQALSFLRYSGSVVYGWKKHDRLLYGFGASRTYRIGESNYIPVILYNYTFPSRKWGIESVFPARVQVRRTFNPRTLAFFGWELEGQTYRLSTARNEIGAAPELRRSEMRFRFTFERSLKDFIWISVQSGLRYNWSFNMDDGDVFRGFGDKPYLLENNLTNALYFNVSLNLVSP